jgi:hypothetical protein
MAAVLTAAAEDFPLKFETIPAQEVMEFPGGSGTFGMLTLDKPGRVRREPKAVSERPLYGLCRQMPSGPAFVCRLDESQGTGQGYDRLIVDMNDNGDLTDDAVAKPVALPDQPRVFSPGREQTLFGPIPAPEGKLIAGGRPVYYAQVLYLFSRQLLAGRPGPNAIMGQLRFKAGWYLDTTVEMGGVKRRVGVFDGDNNLRLGDPWQPQDYQMERGGGRMWYFQPGDSFLVRANDSGKFETDPFESGYCPFGPVLYIGATPCQASLAADNTFLRVEPWKGDLAEVQLVPHGKQVSSLTLARERPNGRWELMQPVVAEGRIKVPPGTYRLYACTLLGSGAQGRDHIKLSANDRTLKSPFRFAAGNTNVMACGAPLRVKVNAEKTGPQGVTSRLLGLFSGGSESVLRISATVLGAEGETYSTFLKGERFDASPPRPTFSVLDARGNRLASGNLEYG